jgi:hypothetical protein
LAMGAMHCAPTHHPEGRRATHIAGVIRIVIVL